MIINANALNNFPLNDNSVDMCVTSPPYWGLRNYGVEGQIGLESTPEEYVNNLLKIFQEVNRVLKPCGTLWLNLGDSWYPHNGSRGNKTSPGGDTLRGRNNGYQPAPVFESENLKQKDLVGIPWLVAFALRNDGWYLRSEIIWNKTNPMPESVKDRPTKSHEQIFLLTKQANYYYDHAAIFEEATWVGDQLKNKKRGYSSKDNGKNGQSPQHHGGMMTGRTMDGHKGAFDADGKLRSHLQNGIPVRNKRDVWTISTKPYKGAHFATFPPDLIEPCILAGCPEGGIVFDPFFGAGTTGLVAENLGRRFVGLELNNDYCHLAYKRIYKIQKKLL